MEKGTKKAILVTSFGTTHTQTRHNTIGAIEDAIVERFPDWDMFRAFTSEKVKKILVERDRLPIRNVPEYLELLAEEGYKKVVIIPTLMLEGEEYYNKIVKPAEAFKKRFESLKIGHAIISSQKDIERVAKTLNSNTNDYSGNSTARVFMGHGSDSAANEMYKKLQEALDESGKKDMIIGVVESEPGINEVIKIIKERGYSKVVVSPLMIVAGEHALNDMAGPGPDSWRTHLEQAGFKVTCLIRGMGSMPDIQRIVTDHCYDAMNR